MYPMYPLSAVGSLCARLRAFAAVPCASGVPLSLCHGLCARAGPCAWASPLLLYCVCVCVPPSKICVLGLVVIVVLVVLVCVGPWDNGMKFGVGKGGR